MSTYHYRIFSDVSGINKVVPLTEGGTEESTKLEAVRMLGGVSVSSIDQTGGLAGLDSNLKINQDLVNNSIFQNIGLNTGSEGDFYEDSQIIFTITDYHSPSQYVISLEETNLTNSTYYRQGENIRIKIGYINSGESSGTLSITIVNQVFTITVNRNKILTPEIINPFTGSTNPQNLVFTSSIPYFTNLAIFLNKHTNSSWEIEGIGNSFTKVVNLSTTNLRSLSVTGLLNDNSYRVRVKYHGGTYTIRNHVYTIEDSEWSEWNLFSIGVTQFGSTPRSSPSAPFQGTIPSYTISGIEILPYEDVNDYDVEDSESRFYSLTMSGDGNIIVYSSDTGISTKRRTLTNSTPGYELEQLNTLSTIPITFYDAVGTNVISMSQTTITLSSDGLMLVVSSQVTGNDPIVSNEGVELGRGVLTTFSYSSNNNEWTATDQIMHPLSLVDGIDFSSTNSLYEGSVSLSSDKNMLVMHTRGRNKRYIITYKRENNTWVKTDHIEELLVSNVVNFKEDSISLSKDKSMLVVGTYKRNSINGVVKTYKRNSDNTEWTLSDTLVPNSNDVDRIGHFGINVSISNSNTVLLISNNKNNIFFYKRNVSNSNWLSQRDNIIQNLDIDNYKLGLIQTLNNRHFIINNGTEIKSYNFNPTNFVLLSTFLNTPSNLISDIDDPLVIDGAVSGDGNRVCVIKHRNHNEVISSLYTYSRDLSSADQNYALTTVDILDYNTPNPTHTGSNYRSTITLSSDGLMLIVMSNDYTVDNSESDFLITYVRSVDNREWVLDSNINFSEIVLSVVLNSTFNKYGGSISLSSDKTMLVVITNHYGVNGGRLFTFKRGNNTWILTDNLLIKPEYALNDLATDEDPTGVSKGQISLSRDKSMLIIGTFDQEDDNPNNGIVKTYKRNSGNTEWIFSDTIIPDNSDTDRIGGFGNRVFINNLKNILIVGNRDDNYFLYSRNTEDDAWSPHTEILIGNPNTYYTPGGVSLSDNGKFITIFTLTHIKTYTL